jgi:hypothetical protein
MHPYRNPRGQLAIPVPTITEELAVLGNRSFKSSTNMEMGEGKNLQNAKLW